MFGVSYHMIYGQIIIELILDKLYREMDTILGSQEMTFSFQSIEMKMNYGYDVISNLACSTKIFFKNESEVPQIFE